MLKRLAMYAAREFEDEVKLDEREGLTRDELQPAAETTTTTEDKEAGKKKGKAKKGRNTGIRQAKIVRAADRIDALSGKGRSRGYGFIETEEHAAALRILRWTNNRPGVVGLMRGWWKEEIKDLVAALEKSEERQDEKETRLKRLKEELDRLETEGEDRSGNKTLILEFAIEVSRKMLDLCLNWGSPGVNQNIQVVKRRKERFETISGLGGKPEGNKKRKVSNMFNSFPTFIQLNT